MKGKMGTHHSTLNCERISTSLHSCFGFGSSGRQYEPEANGGKALSAAATPDHASADVDCCGDVSTLQPQRSLTRRSCCKGAECDKDDLPYDICNHRSDKKANASGCTCSSQLTRSPRKSSTSHARDRKSSGDTSSIATSSESAAQQANSPFLPSGDSFSKRTVYEGESKELSRERVAKNNNRDDQKGFVIDSNASHSVKGRDSDKDSSVKGVKSGSTRKPSTASSHKARNNDKKQATESATPVDENMISVDTFRKLILSETERLNESIDKWHRVLNSNSRCPAEVVDEIRTVIGQTRLVISERFTQFSKLIDRADGTDSYAADGRPVLLHDLQGFWDMIYFQVEDVDAKFNSLDILRTRQWKSEESSSMASKKSNVKAPHKPKAVVKKTTAKKKTQSSDDDRKRREAARKRLAEHRKAMVAHRNQVEQEDESRTDSHRHRTAFADDVTSGSNSGPIALAEGDAAKTPTLKRPESIVDAITCAVAVSHVNNDTTSLSSVSSTGLVHG